jgi:hypothetical protein
MLAKSSSLVVAVATTHHCHTPSFPTITFAGSGGSLSTEVGLNLPHRRSLNAVWDSESWTLSISDFSDLSSLSRSAAASTRVALNCARDYRLGECHQALAATKRMR